MANGLEAEARMQLVRNTHGTFWRGTDIVLAQATRFPKGQTTEVIVNLKPSNLPPLTYIISHEEVYDVIGNMVEATGRSRFAQRGLAPSEETGVHIAHAIVRSDSRNNDGTVEREIPAIIQLTNFGTRDLETGPHTRMCHLFSKETGTTLKGQRLEESIEDGKISIEGTRGIDWFFKRTPNKIAEGIYVRIQPDSFRWIPEAEQALFLENEGETREVVDTLLTSLPEQGLPERILLIAETPPIRLSNRYAVLSSTVFIRSDMSEKLSPELTASESASQINARLLHNVRTDWPVRLEIDTDTKRLPEYVLFTFYPDA